ncbi:MAG: 4Fe-4S dicluster domain-containing protein [Pseudomonadota bacterium]
MKDIVAQTSHPFEPLVSELGNTDVLVCYQCKKCSAGCPMSPDMDILPHQVIRMVQFGMKERLLKSKTIWLCASCETCTTRCPNDVDLAKVMDVLRQMAVGSGMTLGDQYVPSFHAAFLSSIQKRGRIHELEMIARYRLKNREFKKDLKLGLLMFLKGKLKLFSSKVRGKKEIKDMFSQVKKGGLG